MYVCENFWQKTNRSKHYTSSLSTRIIFFFIETFKILKNIVALYIHKDDLGGEEGAMLIA